MISGLIFPRNRRYSYKVWQQPTLAIRPLMHGLMNKTNPNFLRDVLRGYGYELAQVNQAILEIRRRIGERHTLTAQAVPDRRPLPTKVIKRIASARKWRSTEYKRRKPNPSSSLVQWLSFGIQPARTPRRIAPHAFLNRQAPL